MRSSNVNLQGTALLNDPVHSRGTAFTSEERATYRLEGLLPASVDDLSTQLKRVRGHLSAKQTALSNTSFSNEVRRRGSGFL